MLSLNSGGEMVSSHTDDPQSLDDLREVFLTVSATEIQSFTSIFP